MLILSKQHLPRETGASVYGTYSRDGFHAAVLGNGPVASDSVCGRFSFLRGAKGATSCFSDIFKRSRGRQHYVGEWHSHPGGPTTPSTLDNRTLRAIAVDRATNCPECILLLIGGDIANQPRLGVYVYSRERGRVDLHPDGRRRT
ncbi:MAG: Mov34/MPN/PAD-1 family protein [Kiritimatiellae bacterium]|nr:Mov34/MPN/PAD-1 family protein [Kiritimatiellia bacterium]